MQSGRAARNSRAASSAVERGAAAGPQLREGAADAADPGLAVEQVGRERKVAARGELVGLGADVVVQAERLVDDDDGGHGPGVADGTAR